VILGSQVPYWFRIDPRLRSPGPSPLKRQNAIVTRSTEPDTPADKWRFAVSDPSVLSNPDARYLVDEGMDAAPDGYLSESVVQMLPREAQAGKCRICGEVAQLTKEHIPPRSSGNTQRHSSHSFEEWIAQDSIEIPESGAIRQGGIYGYTLCSQCNSFTGRHYGNEYRRWAASTLGAIDAMPSPAELNELPGPFAGRFSLAVRKLAVSGQEHSFVRFSQ
jgi:hypothetical protein